ncbi:MAG: tetratricopeptide repeat protein [Candidatus Cloacimonadales bacterium]|nr:tetratricopeptide repeat protein [Candidatus Cloacimonadales bacterium]
MAFFYLIALNIFAGSIPAETVIAEFDGGSISMGDLDARIEMIPPIYQPKYATPEGKESLLNDLCTEELFFQEALARNVKQDERYFSSIDNQVKSVYFNEYKKEVIDEELTYIDAEKKAYFNENNTLFAGRTYEESEKEIEQRLQPQKEKEFMAGIKAELFAKYEVKLNDDVIASFNLTAIDSNMVNADQILVTGNNPDIELTVGEFATNYATLPDQNKAAIRTNEDLNKYLQNWTELEVFFLKAVELGYENYPTVKSTISQIHRNMMLRTVYNQLVVDPIDISDKGMRKYYKENIAEFSTNPYRKIQTFGFENEDVAKTKQKEVKKLIKKKDDAAISALIAESSVYTAKDGVLDHVYHNGIIPGIGKDEVYNEMVWSTKPNKLSKIFKNSKDVYAFIRILEDVKAVASPFDSITVKVKSQMMKDLSKKNFEDITIQLEKKYNLKKYPERMIVILTSEEYFNKAENAQKRRKFNDAIFYYDQVIKNYPNNVDDYKATFMKGFLYAEELKEKEKALACFNDVLTKFPEGELHESAKFMIDELEGKSNLLDSFESESSSERTEDMNKTENPEK